MTPSPRILRNLIVFAAVVGASVAGVEAHAGIIVTVGRPCNDLVVQPARSPDARQQQHQAGAYANGGDTRCVVLPDGQTRCGKTMRVESVSMLLADWRCTQVAKATLYCETPSFGSSPGAAGEGDFDPDAAGDELFDDEEIQTLGCSGGVGAGGIGGLVGLVVLYGTRRRRAARGSV